MANGVIEEWGVEILCRAFADDPHIRWFIGQRANGATQVAYRRFFRLLLAAPGHLIMSADRQGLAWYLPPGSDMPWVLQMRLFASMLSVHGFFAVPKGLRLLHLKRCRPARPHYWLQLLAVQPEAQGRGVGTELVREMQLIASASGHPIYLETGLARNREFYERRGFNLLQELVLCDGLRLWSMVWQPSSLTTASMTKR